MTQEAFTVSSALKTGVTVGTLRRRSPDPGRSRSIRDDADAGRLKTRELMARCSGERAGTVTGIRAAPTSPEARSRTTATASYSPGEPSGTCVKAPRIPRDRPAINLPQIPLLPNLSPAPKPTYPGGRTVSGKPPCRARIDIPSTNEDTWAPEFERKM